MELRFRDQVSELLRQGAGDTEIMEIMRARTGCKPHRVRETIALIRGTPYESQTVTVANIPTRGGYESNKMSVTLPKLKWMEREIVE